MTNFTKIRNLQKLLSKIDKFYIHTTMEIYENSLLDKEDYTQLCELLDRASDIAHREIKDEYKKLN